MRELTDIELDYVCGGYDDGEDIVVIGYPDPGAPWVPYSPYYPSNPSPPYGGGGGGGSPTPAPSPVNTVLASYDHVTVGHHNIYMPKNMTASEQAAANAFVTGVQAEDAAISKIADGAQVTVVETWTDASGVSHQQSFTETGADFKAHWQEASFTMYNQSDSVAFNNNGSGRGSSNVGSDPNMAGNTLAAYNLQNTVVRDFGAGGVNGQAILEWLALHEVAHQSDAGNLSNIDTGVKNDDFTPGTANYANENLANTIALSAMREMGLNLGAYAAATGMIGGDWQPTDAWAVPVPPDVGIPGDPGDQRMPIS